MLIIRNKIEPITIILVLMISSLFAQETSANIETVLWNGQYVECVKGQILVGLARGVTAGNVSDLFGQLKLRVIEDFDRLNIGLLEITGNIDLIQTINSLKDEETIRYAEPNIVDHAIQIDPNDPYYLGISPASYPHQWALKNTGQDPPDGTPDADIDAPEAWEVETGDSDILIAILDSGIPLQNGSLSHPDLNDPNRFILGPDFVGQAPGVKDERGHGTHVTGIVAAETNNDTGVAGVAWNSKILVIQVFNSYGEGSHSNFRDGVYAAIDSGAKIINYSGGGTHSITKESAVEYADYAGVFQSYSAGNSGASGVIYPARYAFWGSFPEHNNGYASVVSVASTDHNDIRASYSSYDQNGISVSIAAPGGFGDSRNSDDIFSTLPNYSTVLNPNGDLYGYLAGTSMAAPHVTGLAALILSVDPNTTASEIRNALEQSADDVNEYSYPGEDKYVGHGRINAFKALFRTKGYGHITTNVTWYNDFKLKGDVIVDEGVTLTIEPGITVTFPYGAEMHVYGTLIAEGESDNQIVFHSQSSSNSYIVRFYNSTSSASNLEYCQFQNATKGIYIDDSDINVSNCEITDCTYGIYNNYAEPTLYDNSISSCGYAIYNYWSDSDIKNNELNYSGYGIYNYRSSPDIYGNELIGGAFGIRCNSYSSPQLARNGTPGYNYVHDNFMIGLYAEYNSHPFMGYDYCDITGNNSFVDNETGQVSAVSSSSILAELNWWGTSSPPSGWFSGNVDYTPYLASPPGEGLSSPEEEEFDIAFKNTDLPNGLISQTAMSIYDKNWNLWKKTRFARALIYNGDPEDALTICKDIIAQNPDSTLAFYALDLVWQASRLINKERGIGLNDFTDYLEFLSNQKTSKPLYGSAELLLAGFERENGLARVETVFNNYRQTYLAEEALFQKFMFYFNETEDFSMAKSIIDDMDKLFPKSPLTFQAHHLFGDPVSGWSELSITQETANILETASSGETGEMIPDKYELIGVYPNPFNPSTRIKYAIPQLSEIEVDIYNMLGQKIKGFRIVAQQPGIHDLVWDGTNDGYVRVSSGLYIIQFKATSLEDQTEVFGKSVKVTLLK